jgi:hypothetical protein
MGAQRAQRHSIVSTHGSLMGRSKSESQYIARGRIVVAYEGEKLKATKNADT